MISYRFMLILLAIPFGQTVRVNMLGAVSFGKEIANTFDYYFRKSLLTGLNGRRILDNQESSIYKTVTSAFLCRHINFCTQPYETFIIQYLTTQTESIETIFKNLMGKENDTTIFYGQQLKPILIEVRKYIENIEKKITEENELNVWIEFLKKTSILFKENALAFGLSRLDGNLDIDSIKKKLEQTLIMTTTGIELEYEIKLCSEHKICQEKYDCTKSLYDLLDTISTLEEDKVKHFIRIFSQVLTQTNFYNKVSDITAEEFKNILYDMAYSNAIDSSNIFSILKETLKQRIDAIETNKYRAKGKDVKLVHVVLSDLDYFYRKHRSSVFEDFNTEFRVWAKSGGELSSEVRKVLNSLTKELDTQSEQLVSKLVGEVTVFLELTVDPVNHISSK